MTPIIAVLGATGRVGHVVAEQLLTSGIGVRAIGRNGDRLRPLAEAGAEAWAGDVNDPKFLSRAFRHAEAALVMLPSDVRHPDPEGLARSLTETTAVSLQVARVPRAVSISSIGADRLDRNGPIGWLHALERRLDQIPGIHTVHLRAGWFLENWIRNIDLIRHAGINGGGLAPDLPFPMIASRDVGLAAASLLQTPFTGRRTRELQGARSYTSREVTAILGAAIDRPDLAYIQFAEPDLRAALFGAGFSEAMAERYLEMLRGINDGTVKPLEPRSPATTTSTTAEEFARTVFRAAYGG